MRKYNYPITVTQQSSKFLNDLNLYVLDSYLFVENCSLTPFGVRIKEKVQYIQHLRETDNAKAYVWGFQLKACF